MSGWGAAIGGVANLAGSAIGMIGQKKREKRAQGYAKELMGIQHEDQKKLNQQGQELAMKTWNDTNAEAQMEHLKKAGLNPALMYGGSGGGGATSNAGSGGSQAMGMSAQVPPMPMDLGVIDGIVKMASAKLMEKQAEKAGAEADDIREGGISKYLDNVVKRYEMQGDSKEMTMSRSEAYGQAGVSPTSSRGRSIQAAASQAEESLAGAVKDNNIKAAEERIKNFEARMADEGISSNSPFYIKLLTDILRKSGAIEMIKGE